MRKKGCFMAKFYNVCVPRKYKDRNGVEKTHFWVIGKMFPMREKDGFNVQVYTRVLPTEELVLWPGDTQERSATPAAAAEEVGDDDIPF